MHNYSINETNKMKSLQFEKRIVFRFLHLFSHQNRKRCTKCFTKIFDFSAKMLDFCIVNLSLDFVTQFELKMKSYSFRLKEIYIQKKMNHSRLFRTCTSRSKNHTISDEFEILVIWHRALIVRMYAQLYCRVRTRAGLMMSVSVDWHWSSKNTLISRKIYKRSLARFSPHVSTSTP